MDRNQNSEGWLSIAGPERGRRRAGRVFGTAPVFVSREELSEEVIAALKSDPELAVHEVSAADVAEAAKLKDADVGAATLSLSTEELDALTAERARIMADTLVADAVARAVAELEGQLSKAENMVTQMTIARDEALTRAENAEKALAAAAQPDADAKDPPPKRGKG